MPTLSPAYAVPQRGSNDDFNNTFVVTTTGSAGAYTASDAWGTYAGTFLLAPTKHESLFMRQYASATNRVYWLPQAANDNATALSRFVGYRYAYTGEQISSFSPTATGPYVTSWGVPSNAWQSYGNHGGDGQSTCWGIAPNKVRSPSSMGYNSYPNGDGTYRVVPGSSTNADYAAAWNAYILNVRGSYPTSPSDAIFYTDIYFYALTTAPLQACNDTPAAGPSNTSTYLAPYIDAIKNKWGPQAGL